VLDQVEIARGNAEARGQCLLRQAAFQAQAANRAADQRASHEFTTFTESRAKL
jgi:hypothetical protein